MAPTHSGALGYQRFVLSVTAVANQRLHRGDSLRRVPAMTPSEPTSLAVGVAQAVQLERVHVVRAQQQAIEIKWTGCTPSCASTGARFALGRGRPRPRQPVS